MGNGGEHLRALGNEVLDLCLHGVEGSDCLAQFMRAFQADRWCPQVTAKTLRGAGETLQGTGQLTGGNPGHH
ncbi:hypothetical protein D3C77_761110 [compost metagenome]